MSVYHEAGKGPLRNNPPVDIIAAVKGVTKLDIITKQFQQETSSLNTAFKDFNQLTEAAYDTALKSFNTRLKASEKELGKLDDAMTDPIKRLRQMGFNALIAMFSFQSLSRICGTLAGGFGDLVKEYQPFLDISWSLEDMAVKPFEQLEDTADKLTDILDRLPQPMKDFIGLFQAGAYYGGQLFNAISGVLSLIVAWYSGRAMLRAFNSEVRKLDEAFISLKDAQRAAIDIGSFRRNKKDIGGVLSGFKESIEKQMPAPKTTLGKMQKAFKNLGKTTKDFFKNQKSGLSTILKTGAAFAALSLAVVVLSPFVESLSPIFEALATSMQPLADLITPLADDFADWMDSIGAWSSVVGGAIIGFGLLSTALLGVFGTGVATAVSAAVGTILGLITDLTIGIQFGFAGIELAMGPVGWALLAITIAVSAFALAWSQNWGNIQGKTADFINWFNNGCSNIADAFRGLGDSLRGSWTGFTAWIGNSLATLNNLFQPLIDFFQWLGRILGFNGGTGAGLDINGNFKITYAGEPPNINIPPHLQKGGLIRREGLAYLHSAEVVTPRNQVGTGNNNFITINIDKPYLTSDTEINKLANEISEKLRKQLDALGSGR